MIHPELSLVLPYQSGANDLIEGPFLGGYMEIGAPHESATLSGRACGRPVTPGLPEADRRRAFYYTLMPNLLLSLHPDYVNYYLVHPISPSQTLVESEWLVHPDTLGDGANNLKDAVEFWDLTNRQDWHVCELSQAGISSPGYVPGPYSNREDLLYAFDQFIVEFHRND